MQAVPVDPDRIRSAWEGRISGCQLGKAIEGMSIQGGHARLREFLREHGALPLRDYVPWVDDAPLFKLACKGQFTRSEPDDDINYTVLALKMLERFGLDLTTEDVARGWLRFLPGAATFTAERAAYRVLLDHMDERFPWGGEPGFDLKKCTEHEFADWIGAQIRVDMYGWVVPGRPELAADLARRDATLSHTGDGVYGAMFVAALGAAIPASDSLDAAIDAAAAQIPGDSRTAEAVRFGRELADAEDAVERMHERYDGMELHPVHTVNNLCLVVWGLVAGWDDYTVAIGDTVAAGWDTDCTGATVGALWGLSGRPIPTQWTAPWQGTVATVLGGIGELRLDDLIERTVAVARRLA